MAPDSECDLDKLESKWALWREFLTGEDQHSIFNQIYIMLWDAAIWRIINEARRHSEALPGGGIAQNGMIHNFIDRAFFNGQALMIRRLYESEPPQKKRQVSLRGLIKDIKFNAHLLTMRNLRRVSAISYAPIFIKNEVIKPEIFEYLGGRLVDSCKNISIYVDKFVAHASTQENRGKLHTKYAQITFTQIMNAQKVICGVANFLDIKIFSDVQHGCLPLPSPGYLDFISEPLCPEGAIQFLDTKWKEYDEESFEWGNIMVSDVVNYLNT